MPSNSSGLRIDTSVSNAPSGPRSGKSPHSASTRSLTPGSSHPNHHQQRSLGVVSSIRTRMRSTSSASTSSSISLISPAPSSSTASTSSLHLPASASSSTSLGGPSRSSSPVSSTGGLSPRHGDFVLAMHDYFPDSQSATCLSFMAGQIIHVINRDSSGWWDGELEGRRGWFPSNYVTSHLSSLTEEELPVQDWHPGHAHTQSAVSTTSWASTPSPRHSIRSSRHDRSTTDLIGAESESYCPPIMMSLLHGLSVLQASVRATRISHYQPSTAQIIVSVRTILSSTDCLQREAVRLKQFPILAQERGRVLSLLAALVAQTKKAGDEREMDEDEREAETELMLKLAGQLFGFCRRFLAVLVQCGFALPGQRNSGSDFQMSDLEEGGDGDEVVSDNEDPTISQPQGSGGTWRTTNAVVRRSQLRQKEVAAPPRTVRSMGDLRNEKQMLSKNAEMPPIPPVPPLAGSSKETKENYKVEPLSRVHPPSSSSGHKPNTSVSSNSSSSSVSSLGSVRTPATPMFPSGPSTAAEIMEALRYTHDQYLSTIAAFIGQAHVHSRTSHASSTGHMYDLVREVIEMVCKLLTIVEAVMRHPDIPQHKLGNLRAAKEGLYNVTSSLADSVRVLTSTIPLITMTEEEEKATLLRSATDALKAGADCVAGVKMCLSRSALSGDSKTFIIQLPKTGEPDPSLFTPRKFINVTNLTQLTTAVAGGSVPKTPNMNALHAQFTMEGYDDEDMTIQAQSVSSIALTPEASPHPPSSFAPRRERISEDIEREAAELPLPLSPKSPSEAPQLPPLDLDHESVAPGLTSPSLYSRNDDDGTTWEGSHRNHGPKAIEEKILHGDLPSIPPSEELHADPISWMLNHDYLMEDVAYNTEGTLVGATLQALVEKMTPHDSIVDPGFSEVFWLTFRLFSTPAELLGAIITRYNLLPPPNLSQEDIFVWQQRKGMPVRLRISNFIRLWLENNWRHATDAPVLADLAAFNRDALSRMFPGPSQRIRDLILVRTQNTETQSPRTERMPNAGFPINPPAAPPTEIPRPLMTKALLSALRNRSFATIHVTDFDALELARQLTIMECDLYRAIRPEELLEVGKESTPSPANIKAVSSLSTVITGWVSESILSELDTKKRVTLVKFFIKVADRCTLLSNFSTSRSMLAALDSSTISRLHQTWGGVPQKNKIQLESLRKLADHARNYHEYRSRLRNTPPPAVPFLGLYLTDVTFCREGNPSHRASPLAPDRKLLNFNKYHKLARIVQDMKRFQVPYNLKAIPEVQEYLHVAFEKSKSSGDLQDLYRRSLLVEPRQPADNPPTSDVRQLFNWARSQAPQVQS
ncbi:hypothetical protein JAAARDRAFT_54421 [Jaapia argillacea MUCL 33604]|uniref:Ras GEF n=1 Tax=Jaapia argillacea MUCL 33604 TaxID=933084 RepID=A0A067Q617_9AGAM|nr:hypothetical protein JAAARDRAFT_54421 [Jaapia argillacea MUCL 33604]